MSHSVKIASLTKTAGTFWDLGTFPHCPHQFLSYSTVQGGGAGGQIMSIKIFDIPAALMTQDGSRPRRGNDKKPNPS